MATTKMHPSVFFVLFLAFARLVYNDEKVENASKVRKVHMQFQDSAMRRKFLPIVKEEEGNDVEGDLLMDQRKNSLLDQTTHWQDATIPFEIIGPYNSDELQLLLNVFDYYRNHTCINFRPKIDGDTDYISIENTGNGCSSFVGRLGGKQTLKLTRGCFLTFGTVAHELMHSLGFMHEQNRSDRDKFVEVRYENVMRGHWQNFDKQPENTITPFGVPYDYNSVLHYSSNAFTTNNDDTLVPRFPDKAEQMGQRYGLSNFDLSKIIKMYCGPDYIAMKRHAFQYVQTQADNKQIN